MKYILAIGLLLLSGCGVPFMRDESKESPLTSYPPGIIQETEEAVSNVLVSPGSAKFSKEHVLTNPEKHQTIVTGVVDSQNSFGGLMRSSFENVYIQQPDGKMQRRGMLTDNQGNLHIF
jgi:hypothetical protein